MSHRGWKALDGVGIGDEVRAIAIAMDKRAIHVADKINFNTMARKARASILFHAGL
jgi:kynurenine 3-monooxygenase